MFDIINQILVDFKSLKGIKDIGFLFETFKMIQMDLKRDILMEFESS